MRRPKGCRFWTVHDVAAWIYANSPQASDRAEPYNAALWWKANVDAESLRDLNGRELAEFCLEGMRKTRMRDVTDEVQAIHKDEYEGDRPTVAQLDAQVEEWLKDFFLGVK